MTPDDSDSGQLRFRTTPLSDDSDTERLQATLGDFGRLQTTPTPGGTSGSDFARVGIGPAVVRVGIGVVGAL